MRSRDRFLIYGRRSDVTSGPSRILIHPGARCGYGARPSPAILLLPRGHATILFFRVVIHGCPPLAVGRPAFDQWLVWKARESRVPVIDASAVILAIHQTHDYSHHPQADRGARFGEEAITNQRLGAGKKLFLGDATFRLDAEGIKLNPGHLLSEYELIFPPWLDSLLEMTEGISRPLGLRRDSLGRLLNRLAGIRVTRK